MTDIYIDASAFSNQSVAIAPANDLSESLIQTLTQQRINIAGVFDKNKKGDGIYSYDAKLAYDAVIIVSPNYWREIAKNFPDRNVYLYDGVKKKFISLANYLQILSQNASYDVLLLGFNYSNITDLSIVSRALKRLGVSSALIELNSEKFFGIGKALADNSDIPSIKQDALDNASFNAVLTSIDWEQSFGRPFIKACNEKGIATIGIVDGIEDFDDSDYKQKRYPYETVNSVLVMGKDDQNSLAGKQRQVAIVGLPKHFEFYRETPWFPPRPVVAINVNFTYGSFEEVRDEWLDMVVRACSELGLAYTITHHPADKGDLTKYNVSEYGCYDVIRTSSILISRFSTLVLESLILGKPVVYFNPHGETVKLYNDPLGAYSIATTFDELKQSIVNELKHKESVRARSQLLLERKCNISSSIPPGELAAYRVKNLVFEPEYVEFLPEKTYCLPANYVARKQYHHYDDSGCEDEWQLEVYLHALGLMVTNNFESVTDIGCGSGYKLITYLGQYKTQGFELPVNVEKLKQVYPDRIWKESTFSGQGVIDSDVVICSDVIEHLVDPDELLAFLQKQSFTYLILSTPARELCYPEDSPYQMGPPQNPAHQREWSYEEFGQYVGEWFEIIDHRITHYHQATQMVICKLR